MKLVLRMLYRQVGTLMPTLRRRVERVSLAQFERLGVALFDFSVITDLTDWRARRDV